MRRLAVALLALAALAAAPSAAQAQNTKRACTPGSAGIGDPYYPIYGNGGYDVRHYDLDVGYVPATKRLTGDATIQARAEKDLCSFHLDFDGLDISKLTLDGKNTRFQRDGQELTVLPKKPLQRNQKFEVRVRYAGVPKQYTLPGFDDRTGVMPTPEGVTVAGQPEVAAAWFPVNDHPLDKASYTYNVTVPKGYEVAANGFLRDRRDRGNQSEWRWEAPEPMASYLATIDVADWDFTKGRLSTGQPITNAVSTRIGGSVRTEIDSSLSKQGEIHDFLAKQFGAYPFRTTGAIVPDQDDLGFALETQTRPVYSKLFWQDKQGNGRNGDSVVVHELAHQWYGDDVALGRWQDIWLNEGFASYAEWLWAEHEGQGSVQDQFKAAYDEIPAADPFWALKIGDPGVEHLFDEPVYTRGAMALQALRNEVGDAAFFRIARRWASSKSGGNGTIPEFIALAEKIAGRPLDSVFTPWLFTASRPAFSTPKGAQAPQAQSRTLTTPPSWRTVVRDRLQRVGRY